MTDDTKVYLVFANRMREGSVAILAFIDEKRAQAFCDKCNQYHQTKEDFPDEANYDNAALEAYIKRDQTWQALHPSGVLGCGADNFTVGFVPLDSSRNGCSTRT